jgi:hypothetical protein
VARRPVVNLAAAFAVAAPILGACGARPPHPSPGAGAAPSSTPVYQIGQAWDAPPGWRLRVTGMRCAPAATLRPGNGSEEPAVCLVAVAFTNLSQIPRPFRVQMKPPARPGGAPGASGTSELNFEVPAGLALSRVLVGDAFVRFQRSAERDLRRPKVQAPEAYQPLTMSRSISG